LRLLRRGEIAVDGQYLGALAREQHRRRLAVAPAGSDRARRRGMWAFFFSLLEPVSGHSAARSDAL
jgi:hypothetical protein